MIALAAPLALVLLPSPQATSGCNNLTRNVSIESKTTPAVTAQCSDVSVTVGVFNITTPAECIVAYTHCLETVWSCGPAVTGIHCDAQGSKAYHNNYTDGACPVTTGVTDGMTWTYPWEIPDAIAGVVWGLTHCIEPEKTTEFDYSAKCTNCATTGQPITSGSGAAPLEVVGDPSEALGSYLPHDPFATPLTEAVRAGGTVQNPDLAPALLACPSIPAAEIQASLSIEHYDAGESTPHARRSQLIEGWLTEDGLFDLVCTYSVRDPEGESFPVRMFRYFDGRAFRLLTCENDEGGIYVPGGTDTDLVWRYEVAPEIGHVYRWLVDPLEVPRFEEHTLTSTLSGQGAVDVARTVPTEGGSYTSRTTHVSTTGHEVPVVLSTTVLDSLGRIQRESNFARHQDLGGGLWRPMTIRTTRYLHGTPDGPRIKTELRVQSFEPKDKESATLEILTKDFGPSVVWNVWL